MKLHGEIIGSYHLPQDRRDYCWSTTIKKILGRLNTAGRERGSQPPYTLP